MSGLQARTTGAEVLPETLPETPPEAAPAAEPASPTGTTPEDGIEEGVRIRTHPGLCLGYGNCHRWAPHIYPLDEEGQIAVHVLEVGPEEALAAWRGASVCPEGAITVIGPPESHWAERQPARKIERESSVSLDRHGQDDGRHPS